jgi:hypothetical protein
MDRSKTKRPVQHCTGLQKWQPVRGCTYNPCHTFKINTIHIEKNILRFNPVQIGEWLDDLLARKIVQTKNELSRYVGMSRTRIGQFLVLMNLPEKDRRKYKQMEGLREYQLRRSCVGD